MRLIDADELMERLLKKKPGVANNRYTDGYNDAVMRFRSMIHGSPTVDAEPVVRCKDCRYSRKPNRYDRDENAACEGVLICCVGFDHIYPSVYDGLIFTDENDYCSYGERKGGNND